MKRNRIITPVLVLVLALLAVAAAAYAPHSATWRGVAQNNVLYTPCRSTMTLRSTELGPTQQTAKKPLYPAPSEEVIARGHSGQAH